MAEGNDLELTSDVELQLRKLAIQNAIHYNGTADKKSILSKFLGSNPEWRTQVKKLMPKLDKIVAETNKLSLAQQQSELETLAPELLTLPKKGTERAAASLPELTNVPAEGGVVMRFAPGPSGPLHIGHSRAIVLNDEYVKRYGGKLIIRIEDTNPVKIDSDAYEMIIDDLDWFGVEYHEVVTQSDRFEIYYEHAEKLLELGQAYICECEPEAWRELKRHQKPCPDRALSQEEHLSRWQKMMEHGYKQGEASFVVKTDLNHPNPAVRDFVGLRIIDSPHPKTGDKYWLFPVYNYSCAIDDYLLNMTHILRGKDHLNNTHRQKYVYQHLGWPTPEFIHYGWVSIEDTILKTSLIREGIDQGQYSSWDDIRLGTLRALRKRGFQPGAFRKYWLDTGTKEVDIKFSWKTLYALNKDIVDKRANRYFFVWEPTKLIITDINELEGHAPLHPDEPERGMREVKLTKKEGGEGLEVMVVKDDLELLKLNDKFRLKDLANVQLTSENTVKYIGNDLALLKEGIKIIHWVSGDPSHTIPTRAYMPDNTLKSGLSESAIKNDVGNVVQFERLGFVKVELDATEILAWFAHR
ncbi:MAG: glutamate--tRNA ligase [Thermoplasmata archaeon]|nr:glutamate--tRNA ligase [Thermoplasmata archaeon]